MESVEQEIQKKRRYDINPQIAASYCLLCNYTKGARQPIEFAHYTHEHPITSRVAYKRSSRMCTLFFFLTGKFGFLVGDTMYDPNYGDVMVFRDYEKFTSVFYSNSYVDYYQINIPSEFFDVVELPTLFYRQKDGESVNMLVPDRKSSALILDKLKDTEDLILSGEKQTELLIYGNLLQILGMLALCTEQHGFQLMKIPAKMKQALEYMHSNFSSVSGIEEIAQICGVSCTYLSRMFQKNLSCTPNEYLNRLRIAEAKYLLSTGSSITDACYRSGFNNYTYFISKFKSLTGLTPAKFKSKK